MRSVYVLNQNGNALMPTIRFGKVRRMLKSGEAKVVQRLPFTIQLQRPTKTNIVQKIVLGCDPGRTNIGLAAVRSDGTDLYRSHCTTRNKEIVKLMSDRRGFRRASRRGERLDRKRLAKRLGTTAKHLEERLLPGCETPITVKDIINTEARFNNRLRPAGWLTPSAMQLLRTHINLIKKTKKILPISDVAIEVNKFAFMQLDNPDMAKENIDFRHGPLYQKGGVKEAVKELQNNTCLLCNSKEIDHYHHIIGRSRRGSNTLENLVGLCEECHEKVHKSKEAADKLTKIKTGLTKKYGGTSVLNQIISSLIKALSILFKGHLSVTTGWITKAFRDTHGIEKDHDTDAYCIAASTLYDIEPKIQTDKYEVKQFRRHNRARIHHQTERVYKLDGKLISKNRKKRMDQKDDALDDWFKKMADEYGLAAATAMRSRLTVQKSLRYYNNMNRILPGMTFQYQGKRYVMSGQKNRGYYYLAVGEGIKPFSSKKVKIISHNTGIVYI